jgi:hypothetical protein
MTKQDRSKGFYETKGMVRHTVVFTAAHKEKLRLIAKQHGVTQGEAVEVLLDGMDSEALAELFKAKRAGKTDGRTAKTDLAKKLKGLPPEKLAQIQAILDAQ